MNCSSNCCTLPDNKCGRCLRVSVTPIVCFVLIASVGLVVVLGEVLVKEHVNAKHFLDSTCTVTEHVDMGSQTCSKCISSGGYGYSHSDCYESSFPCVQIQVRLTEKNGTTLDFGIIHTSASQLTDDPLCSVSVCNRNPDSNVKEVNKFLSRWPINHQSPCVYNPHNPTEVLIAKHYSTAAAVNALLWPSLVAVVCIVVLVVRCVQGADPCSRKVKQWDPVTLRSMCDNIRNNRCVSALMCCKKKSDSDVETAEPRHGRENIAFDKF